MTTKLVTPTNEPGDLDALTAELKESVTMEPAEGEEPTHTPVDGNAGSEALDIPKKYQGKTIAEVIEMHRNLESAYGRQANDLGSQRKMTDKLLDLKRTDDLSANAAALPEVSAESLLDNPTQALDSYLDAREQRTAESTEQRLAQMEAALSQEHFQVKHPDAQSIGDSPEFAAWVSASPLRTRYANLAMEGNWQAAGELLDEYKARPDQKPVENPLDAARDAGFTSAQTTSDAAARSTKKIYRRADLIRLKLERPQVYEDPQFQEEILAAYAEGRVK